MRAVALVGSQAYSLGQTGSLQAWGVEGERLIGGAEVAAGVEALACAGEVVYAAARIGSLGAIHEIRAGTIRGTFELGPQGDFHVTVMSVSSRSIAVATTSPGLGSAVMLVSRRTGRLGAGTKADGPVVALCFSGSTLVGSCGSEQTDDHERQGPRLFTWDPRTTEPAAVSVDQLVTALLPAPDGTLLTGSQEGLIIPRSLPLRAEEDRDRRSWFVARGLRQVEQGEFGAPVAHHGAVRAMLLLSGGRSFLSVSGLRISDTELRGEARCWDLVARSEVREPVIASAYTCATISSDERLLLLGRRDGGLELWDVRDFLPE